MYTLETSNIYVQLDDLFINFFLCLKILYTKYDGFTSNKGKKVELIQGGHSYKYNSIPNSDYIIFIKKTFQSVFETQSRKFLVTNIFYIK